MNNESLNNNDNTGSDKHTEKYEYRLINGAQGGNK